MDTLDFDRILDAMTECAHGLLEYAPQARLNAYTALELLTRKLEDRQAEFPRVAASQHYWRIRAHADAAMGFSRGNGETAESHLERILEAIDDLRAAAGVPASQVAATQRSLQWLCPA
jgi:hypothetical protein